jgi:CHASE2 domain-containing sensor protein
LEVYLYADAGVPRRRIRGLLVIAFLAVGAGLASRVAGLLSSLERPTVDAHFSIRGAQHPPANVVVVRIDSNSTGHLPAWPF